MNNIETIKQIVANIKAAIPEYDLNDQADWTNFTSWLNDLRQDQFTKPICAYAFSDANKASWNANLDLIYQSTKSGDLGQALKLCDQLTQMLSSPIVSMSVPKPKNKRA